MLAPIPYLDVAGYKRRSKVIPTDVDLCASLYSGYIEHRIAVISSRINARLQKRYRVPLGQEAPVLVAAGTAPPAVTLSGRPTLGSYEMALQIDGAGALGAATFRWSSDGGETWAAAGVTTSAAVSLGATGLVADFGAGTYATDNAWTASTPVPEIALGWLTAILDVDVWQKRGVNPQDPSIATAIDERTAAIDEVTEAANSETGLFDLPTNDAAGDSAIVHGGPMSYSEASPYVWQDLQVAAARCDDRARSGDFGSTDS